MRLVRRFNALDWQHAEIFPVSGTCKQRPEPRGLLLDDAKFSPESREDSTLHL